MAGLQSLCPKMKPLPLGARQDACLGAPFRPERIGKADEFFLLSLAVVGSLHEVLGLEVEENTSSTLKRRALNIAPGAWALLIPKCLPMTSCVGEEDSCQIKHEAFTACSAMCFAKDKISSPAINSWWRLQIPSRTPSQ